MDPHPHFFAAHFFALSDPEHVQVFIAPLLGKIETHWFPARFSSFSIVFVHAP
jgi:hypothetical protein